MLGFFKALLSILLVFDCLLLLVLVLVQSGSGGGLASAFGGGGSEDSLLGAKSNVTLNRLTSLFATGFMVICCLLAYLTGWERTSRFNPKNDSPPASSTTGETPGGDSLDGAQPEKATETGAKESKSNMKEQETAPAGESETGVGEDMGLGEGSKVRENATGNAKEKKGKEGAASSKAGEATPGAKTRGKEQGTSTPGEESAANAGKEGRGTAEQPAGQKEGGQGK